MVCFNPCFYGTTSSTLPSAVNTRRQAEFQSLFLWNDLFNKNPVFSKPTVTGSFNPCFYGTTSSTMWVMVDDGVLNPFQSLFLWNDLFNAAADLNGDVIALFQSLFLWNDLFNPLGKHGDKQK